MLFFIILTLSFASGHFLPWWAAAIISFVAAFYLGKSTAQSFWSGFTALFIAWTALALLKSIPNNNSLATRVAKLFHLPNWVFLLAITALIGGVVGGMAALSGILTKKALTKNNS
jgi:hypothetical protein